MNRKQRRADVAKKKQSGEWLFVADRLVMRGEPIKNLNERIQGKVQANGFERAVFNTRSHLRHGSWRLTITAPDGHAWRVPKVNVDSPMIIPAPSENA